MADLVSGGAEIAVLGIALAVAVAVAVHYLRQAVARGNEIRALEEAIVRDPLTGLLNRHGFEERMEIELQRAIRDRTPLALVVGDLDDFKEVNDRLGHLGGDMALERVSGVIARTTRRADAAARLGGDEFAFILPNTTALEAEVFAERLRIAIERSFFGTAAELTLSLGVAGLPDGAASIEPLLHAADQAMYWAKSLGKNQTAVPDRPMAEVPA